MRRIGLTVVLLCWSSTLPAAESPPEDGWDDWGDDWDEPAAGGLVWTGFVEGGFGVRTDGTEPRRATLAELRARAETEWVGDAVTLAFKGDVWNDAVTEEFDAELRELTASFSLGERVDVTAGQQVLTWGTGDLVFLNDLFPKDFQSFFAGRDDEYLKAPSASVRLTHYGDAINTDLVWTPVFEPDSYLTGERFSFYLPGAGAIGVPEPDLSADEPDGDLAHGELALRLFTRREATEYALYGYRGYYKQPTGVRDDGTLYHPKLSVYGASVRRPAGSGVFNAEVAWYDSREDRGGDDPRVPNSQARLLFGYERELIRNWQIGVQYYAEWTDAHDRAEAAAVDPALVPDELRSLLTARITGRLNRETLSLSLFTFYSPSDEDVHYRPQASYRLSDAWTVTAGANLFAGDSPATFFGQLDRNDNAWVRVTRYY